MLLNSRFEVTQSIFLECRWERRTQWSQRSRPIVLKWLHLWANSLFSSSAGKRSIPSCSMMYRSCVEWWVSEVGMSQLVSSLSSPLSTRMPGQGSVPYSSILSRLCRLLPSNRTCSYHAWYCPSTSFLVFLLPANFSYHRLLYFIFFIHPQNNFCVHT